MDHHQRSCKHVSILQALLFAWHTSMATSIVNAHPKLNPFPFNIAIHKTKIWIMKFCIQHPFVIKMYDHFCKPWSNSCTFYEEKTLKENVHYSREICHSFTKNENLFNKKYGYRTSTTMVCVKVLHLQLSLKITWFPKKNEGILH
jgi:hypothetical protein